MTLRSQDRDTLRSLAAKYMEYALSPANVENRELWRRLNDMQMQKPMVTIHQMPWHELDVDGFLVCSVEDPYFRGIESNLRTEIYKWEHMPVDMVLNPYIILPRPVTNTGFGLESRALKHKSGSMALSHLFEDQLAEMEDVAKIQTPRVSLDEAMAAEILAAAHEIFDGVAPVQWGGIMLHSGLWDSVTCWKGVESCYIDLIDRPELIHAIMDRFTNAFIDQIRQINTLGIYDVNSNMCHCSHTFSDRLPDTDPDHATSYGGWTFSMAQLFTSVSPAINLEFEVPYMSKIFSYFGSVYYGCCERLDDRLDIIDRMPNIRKVSCSPWSDRDHFAAVLPKKYIMSCKPNPSYLAGASFDEDVVRKDLRWSMDAAKANGLGMELLLKDISTVRNDPQRLWRWAEIAKEETMNAVL